MKNGRVMGEERDTIKYWFPGSVVFAAIMLMVLVIMLVGFVLFSQVKWSDSGSLQEVVQQTTDTFELQQETLDKKAVELEALENELKQREAAMNELDSIKVGIFQELAEKLAAADIAVEMDEAKGSVRFSDMSLFSVNKSEINAAGKEYLDRFLQEYFAVLLSEKNLKYIDRITIEGHADEDGSYDYNLKLSQDRAVTVVNNILGQNYLKAADGTDLKELLAISGRSSSEPFMVDGVIDRSKSRRVEFIFSLKNGV